MKLSWLFPPKQWHPGSGGGFFCSQQKSLAALARRHPVFLLGSRRKNHGVTPPTDVGTFWLCGIPDLFASNEIGLGVYHPSSPVHCKSWERFVITLLKEIVDVPLMVVKKKLLAFRKIEHHLWVKGKICKDFAPDFKSQCFPIKKCWVPWIRNPYQRSANKKIYKKVWIYPPNPPVGQWQMKV